MDHLFYLRKAIEVSKKSRDHGNTPFGAILVDGEGNILLEQENIEIPKSTSLENIKCNENEKTVNVSVWMPLVRNEMEEQAVKKTLTIPQWLNQLAEAQNVNFSKVLQSALKDYLRIKRIL